MEKLLNKAKRGFQSQNISPQAHIQPKIYIGKTLKIKNFEIKTYTWLLIK